MEIQQSNPKTEDQNPKTDFVGWLLEDVKPKLAGEQTTIIETAPPRAAGPLGEWRIVRCRYNATSGYELLVAREQLPNNT